jgi:Ca2+-binding RTX toxin-like protein
MTHDYSELANYVKANSSEPIQAAKIILAWEWSALLPGGGGATPTSAEEVVSLLKGECGLRDILLRQLFSEIGIQSRRVNFSDVPFQINHSASELFINGKWMFFDASMGVYFESKQGGDPLSIEDIRKLGPNEVVMKQTNLVGWQGVWVDPNTLSSLDYHTALDRFYPCPVNYNAAQDWIRFDIINTYFGYNSYYYDMINKKSTPISSGLNYIISNDSKNIYSWTKIIDTYDANGTRIYRWLRGDSGNSNFYEWNPSGLSQWISKVTVTDSKSIIDFVSHTYDGSYYNIVDNDNLNVYNWDAKNTYFTNNKIAYQQICNYDAGSMSVWQWDVWSIQGWSSINNIYNSNGELYKSSIVYDNNISKVIYWTSLNSVIGNGIIQGSSIDQLLLGGYQSDSLISLDGSCFMSGGEGDDTYTIKKSDIILEFPDSGIDTVVASFNYILRPNFENLTLVGVANNGYGNSENNIIYGNNQSNLLQGFSGDDKIYAQAGNDTLYGGVGNDVLCGGEGNDLLFGGGSADVFLISSANLNGLDTIADFVSGEDKLSINSQDYGIINLDASNFITTNNGSLTLRNPAFIYNNSDQSLCWDSNGSASGGICQLIRFTSTNVNLSTKDFIINSGLS